MSSKFQTKQPMLEETVLTSGNLLIDKSIADMDSAFLEFQRIRAGQLEDLWSRSVNTTSG
jgi:hypothetical protein